ncbi:MAG: ATP-binding protein [Bacteroidota bacterium]
MGILRNISIRNKLITIQAVTALMALLICCSLFVFIGINTFRTSTVRKMYSIARIAGDNSASALQFMDQEAAHAVLVNLGREPEIKEAVLLDKKGAIFSRNTETAGNDLTIPPPVKGESPVLSYEFDGRKLKVGYRIYQEKEYVGTLLIKAELLYLTKIVRSYLLIAGMVLVAGFITALIISYFLQQMISSRLLALVAKTREVTATGNYSLRVESDDNDEIGILSKEFNGLLGQIDKMETSLREANSDLERRVQIRTAELESANKELESFSYTVSHDLKAPLRAINGFTDILVKKYADQIDDKGKEIAGIIVANARKMGQLIQDLLEFSRIGRKELTMDNVSMDDIVQHVLTEMKAQNPDRNVSVKVAGLPPAHGDKNLLTQVWVNFIGNAYKYSGHKEKAEIEIGTYKQGKDNVFFIKDNGAGFDMRYIDKLFRVFQRLHGSDEFEGTGVGLAIVNRIVTRHGGKVWAEGKPDQGATFSFSLPA